MTSDSVSDARGTGSDGSKDALAEALSIVRGASERGIAVRLVGGLAVRVLCPDLPPRHGDAQDLDFVSVGPARQGLTAFLSDLGYVPDRTFNALYGRKQLFFSHGETGRAVDVIIDRLDMCHALEFKDRIERMPYTLDLPDLLLSKLQIVELNDKDAQDIVYLLSTYPIRESEESGVIDLNVFRRIVGDDWGWWRTVTMNLDRIESLLKEERNHLVPKAAGFDPIEQLELLRRAADDAPKNLRWKMRARVGDRVRWYRTPEETEHR
jgi:hypothetical protein